MSNMTGPIFICYSGESEQQQSRHARALALSSPEPTGALNLTIKQALCLSQMVIGSKMALQSIIQMPSCID